MSTPLKPSITCVACGRVGKRGFRIVGGFYMDRVGDWWQGRRIPAMFVCSARQACMGRISPGLGNPAAFINAYEPWESQPKPNPVFAAALREER